MKTYTLKAVPTAGAVEPKNNNKAAKAKRILVGWTCTSEGIKQAVRSITAPSEWCGCATRPRGTGQN